MEKEIHEQLRNTSPMPKPFTWSDLALPANDWRRGVVGIISNLNKELTTEENESIVRRATELINKQINYCQHINLPATVVDLSGGKDVVSLANILNAKLNSCLKVSFTIQTVDQYKKDLNGFEPFCFSNLSQPNKWNPNSTVAKHEFGSLVVHYWIRVPMASQDVPGDSGIRDPWKMWNTFRTLCEFDRYVCPVLELQADVPSSEEIDRWLGEPVKAIFISTSVFLSNAQNFPVLSKAHQMIVRKFLKVKAQIVVEAEEFSLDLKGHQQYIQFLSNKENPVKEDSCNGVENFALGYEDVLQIPLQPLRDHLESGTYEVFEKDPVKYVLYEDAIYEALVDRVSEKPNSPLVLMVVGAGRGPLVMRCLDAALKADKFVHVYAVEKNTNAINTLYHLRDEFWGDRVTVVCADMREFDPPVQADIIISELLGSLGDNELSPECLDGAQRFLKPDGVMIPKNYTSYVAPVMSVKYHQDVGLAVDQSTQKFGNYETTYIIHMNNKYIIAPPQKLFTFEHPNFEANHSNERHLTIKFMATQECILNGFSGYFESVLYGDICMSILPSTHSHGMFSWFPMFIPLRDPILVKKGEEIIAHFWRRCSKVNVWYEWTITSPKIVGIHNANGRSGAMQL